MTLHHAARLQSPSLVQLLLDKGLFLHHTDKYRRTPLLWSCYHEAPIEIVKLLIDNGSDVNH
ncbi:MAG: ankyrin repeat domain-containing protein [Flammeovirgaceae bacterium]